MNRKTDEAEVYAPIQIVFSSFHARRIKSNRYFI